MPVITTNTAANTAVRYLNTNSASQSDSLAKLASGSRITKASDDAAGLAISTKISSDVSALEQASTNASHGISILQTADGAASNVSDILERMKVLASQSASGTVTDTERAYIQAEFAELQDEIDGIASSTRYNGQSLLDGTSDFTKDITTEAAAATITTTLSADITATSGDTLSFDLNGTSISLTATSTAITVDEIVTAINAQTSTTGVTASKDGTGALVLTDDGTGTASSISISNVAGTGTTLATADLGDLGLTDGDTNDTATATGTYTAVGTDEVEAATSGSKIVVGSDSSDTITLKLSTLTTESLEVDDLDISTQTGAETALEALDAAINEVSNARAEMGAIMSRFEFRSSQIDTSIENLDAAQSAIADVDIASEQSKLSATSVMVQAAVAAASQANQMPENLLKLLQ
jgi:flagellin